jgi:hypothetical protein
MSLKGVLHLPQVVTTDCGTHVASLQEKKSFESSVVFWPLTWSTENPISMHMCICEMGDVNVLFHMW